MKKLIFGTLGVLSALLFVGILLRMGQSNPPREDKKLVETAEIGAAAAADGSVTAERQMLRSYITEFGYFHCDYIDYVKQCSQAQMTVWFNRSTLYKIPQALEQKYNKAFPQLHGMPFTFELIDERGNLVSQGTVLLQRQRGRYTFLRLSFENLDFSQFSQLTLRFCCDSLPQEDRAVTSMLVYHADMDRKSRTVTFTN